MATDLLSRKAEVFRSKLISDFHLIENIGEGGAKIQAPRHHPQDISGL